MPQKYRYQKTHTQWLSGNWAALKGAQLKLRLLERMASSAEGQERFWSRVQKGKRNECWNWTLSFHDSGYGLFSFSAGPSRQVSIRAHRISYFLKHGKLPKRPLVVCHTCDNRKCVNPAHLFEGTRQINVQDMVQKNRQAIGSRIYSTRLTPEQVQQIRFLHFSFGIGALPLAEMFGVTGGSTYPIIYRHTWKYLPVLPCELKWNAAS